MDWLISLVDTLVGVLSKVAGVYKLDEARPLLDDPRHGGEALRAWREMPVPEGQLHLITAGEERRHVLGVVDPVPAALFALNRRHGHADANLRRVPLHVRERCLFAGDRVAAVGVADAGGRVALHAGSYRQNNLRQRLGPLSDGFVAALDAGRADPG